MLASKRRGNRWHPKTKEWQQSPCQRKEMKLGEGCEFTQGQRMAAKGLQLEGLKGKDCQPRRETETFDNVTLKES